MPLFIFLTTHKQCIPIKSIIHNSIAMTSRKPYTLAGFEPRSSVPEADAMSTAPGCQGFLMVLILGNTVKKLFELI
jgi:hypothetical protein